MLMRRTCTHTGGSGRSPLPWALLAWALLAGPLAAQAAPPLKLHVPSPDWRDQVLYFVMTDRFEDGNPANNDQGAGEFNPASNAHYSGGDFAGLKRRLGYIRGLGVTGLWITPPVANQWWDASVNYGGYHGYWAENFLQVDKHLGTLDDYRRLSDALHRRGMVLVQDIVLNHTGNFFRYAPGQWSATDPTQGWQANTASRPNSVPTQPPFDQNDPRNPDHRAAGVYHWTPDIQDYSNPEQALNWQLSGLDDLNTENPAVRQALRRSYAHWIKQVGVDGFRLDTAFYVPPAMVADFLQSTDPTAPGIQQVARTTGRRSFYTFGEGFAIDKPFGDAEMHRIEAYVRTPTGQPVLPGMLNFPLYGSLGDVLARGAPTAVLAHRIARTMTLHSAPHHMASFVDNHDIDRFLTGSSSAALQQALLTIMTLPGVPIVYYGTEQGFTEQRGAMFAAGFGSGGRDRFDTAHPLYQAIARMTALRRAHRLFSRGVPTVLQHSATGPGVLAWRMDHGTQAGLVVLNTADTPTLLHGLPTGLRAGTRLASLLALDGAPHALTVGPGGLVNAVLPPRSGQVWRLAGLPAAKVADSTPAINVDSVQLQGDGNQALAHGRAPAGMRLQLVFNGDLARATAVQTNASGRWQAMLDTGALTEATAPHQLVAWSAQRNAASAAVPLQALRQWTEVAVVDDPAGDDRGPDATYVYPTDGSWATKRSLDLRGARVSRSGSALKIELTMADINQVWNPSNGFDHLAVTVFFSQPGRSDGLADLPQQQASLPGGLRWQHRIRAHGWSNALYSAAGANASHEGTPTTPGAQITVDAERKLLRFTLPAGALGPASSLAGLRIYVATWDHDGSFRALAPQPGAHSFGGGEPGGAKVMDDLLITLP